MDQISVMRQKFEEKHKQHSNNHTVDELSRNKEEYKLRREEDIPPE